MGCAENYSDTCCLGLQMGKCQWPTPGTGEIVTFPPVHGRPKGESCLLCSLNWSLDTECFGSLLKFLKIKETGLSSSPKERSTHALRPGHQKGEWP